MKGEMCSKGFHQKDVALGEEKTYKIGRETVITPGGASPPKPFKEKESEGGGKKKLKLL